VAEVAVRAPGRVNLIGDHTDYNDGFVLPLAIGRDCRVVGRATGGELRLRFRDGGDDNSLRIAEAVRKRLGVSAGLDADVHSTVPVGSGLSSSSAFAVALATAFCAAAGIELPPDELARACQEAETAATGVPGGIMDQLTSVRGRAGCALLIDCRTLEVSEVALGGLEVVVVESGLPRRLAHSAYAERRAHCEAVAAELGLRALRDARPAQVEGDSRARHVVSENARVLAAAAALAGGDGERVGRLMLESHASLRDDYEVSTPELDELVERLLAAGALGARLTGAGFGGCVVGLAAAEEGERIAAAVGGFVVGAVDGAGPVSDAA
jgi:galactokinase